jgi:hypothetical protein
MQRMIGSVGDILIIGAGLRCRKFLREDNTTEETNEARYDRLGKGI